MTDHEDLPKMVAAIMWTLPRLVIKSGFSYLRMKRRAKRSSKDFMRGMIRGGMPPEVARKLSEKQGAGVSIRKLIGGFVGH